MTTVCPLLHEIAKNNKIEEAKKLYSIINGKITIFTRKLNMRKKIPIKPNMRRK